jgi:hypothetical protein
VLTPVFSAGIPVFQALGVSYGLQSSAPSISAPTFVLVQFGACPCQRSLARIDTESGASLSC